MRWVRTVCLSGLLMVALAVPQTRADTIGASTPRPRIGLVLGGGGARGAAHIGVIRVLERLRIPVDYVVGTSMGSIVGGLYASGLTADELEAALAGIDWNDIFTDRSPRQDQPVRDKRDRDTYLVQAELGYGGGEIRFPPGLVQGQKIDLAFKALTLPVTEIEDFDRLPIPFRAVAADILTGREVVLGRGDLAQAMRASMSVPALFAPTRIDGQLLVDGGVANNVPVNVARAMGADRLIVVDVGSPPLTQDEVDTVLGITSQLTWILTARNVEQQLATLSPRDILIRPELGPFSSADFEAAMAAVPIGVAAAEDQLQALQALSVAPQVYRRHLADRATRRGVVPVIQFVRLENQSSLSDRVLTARLQDHLDKPLDTTALEQDIAAIYGLGNFESVRYEVVREDDRTGMVLHAREKSWGPNYLQFGLQLSSTDDGESSFNVGALFKRSAVNRLNGELRSGFQLGQEPRIGIGLYQPLDDASRYFLAPLVVYGQRNFNVFEDGSQVGEYRISSLGGELALGRNFGTWGELRAGLRRFTGDAEVRSGEAALGGFDFDRGEAFLQFTVDKLDDTNFPQQGYRGGWQWTASRDSLGADTAFDQLEAGVLLARTWGRHTGTFSLRYASTVRDSAPAQNLFRLGGFTRLSGLAEDELSGQHAGLVSAAYLRRINDIRFLPAYLGGTLEAGNVWQDQEDIGFDAFVVNGSVFLGLDTFLGPLYLGLGHGEGGRDNAFLFLGRAFKEQ